MKSFIKKFLLILLGIFLSLIILELSLRFAGFAVSSYQQYKNNIALENKSQYNIMCLGESTTAGQYPIQLQQILDKKYPNKFSVIDCGIPGTKLEFILKNLDLNIKKFKPHFTVLMIGINNEYPNYYVQEITNNNILSKFQIYKLYLILKYYIQTTLLVNGIKFNKTLLDRIISDYGKQNDEKKYISFLEKMLKFYPDSEDIFSALVISYYFNDNKNLRKKSYDMSIQALNKHYIKNIEFYYLIIFTFNYEAQNTELLQHYINKSINEHIGIYNSIFCDQFYEILKHQNNDHSLFDTMKKNNIDKFYRIMAVDYLNQKNPQQYEQFILKAESLTDNYLTPEFYNLYKQIVTKLINNNIKVICMQYPTRNIKPLQELLKNESYYDKIIFVSNEDNFKKAIMDKSFGEIFVDRFAGDFGHCTDFGNTMIAENVVKSLEKLIN